MAKQPKTNNGVIVSGQGRQADTQHNAGMYGVLGSATDPTGGMLGGAAGTVYGARVGQTGHAPTETRDQYRGATDTQGGGNTDQQNAASTPHEYVMATLGRRDSTAQGQVGAGAATGGIVPTMQWVQGRKRALGEQNRREQRTAEDVSNRDAAGQLEWAAQFGPQFQQYVQQYMMQSGGRPLDPAQLQQAAQQYQAQQWRSGLTNEVDAYFNNPALATSRKKYIDQLTADALANLQQNVAGARRQNAFATAATGQQGSSMQAERGAAVGQQRDMAAAQIASAGQRVAEQFKTGDQALRQRIMETIYAASPEDAERTQATLAGLRNAASMEQDREATQQLYGDINRRSQQAMWQAAAGGVNTIAGGVRRGSSYPEGA